MNSMSNIPQLYQDMMQRSPFAAAMAAQLSNMAHQQKLNAFGYQPAQFNPMALAALSQFKNPMSHGPVQHMTLNELNQSRRGRPPRALNLSGARSRSRSPHSGSSTASGPKSLNTRTSTPSKTNEDEAPSEEEIDEIEEDIEIDEIDEDDYVEDLDTSDLNTTSASNNTAKKSRADDPSSKLTPSPLLPAPVFDFSMQALEMSLYGYLRQSDPMFMGHALSGLRYLVAQQHKNQQLQNKSTQDDQNKQETLSPSSSSSSPKNAKKSNFSIENLLTSSSSSSSSSSSPAVVPHSSNSSLLTPTTLPDLDKLDLPDGLQIRPAHMQDMVHYGVFCKKTVIPKNTRFGPYPGKSVHPSEINKSDENSSAWEMYTDGKLSSFMDPKQPTSSAKSNNQWMVYVNCARFAQEQNLIAVQSEGEIFYETCKDIAQGQELLVWYGDTYLQFMGIPVSSKDMADEINEHESDENKDGYTCDRCGKVFAYKYYRDKHLKYTRCVDQGDRKFPCHLCTRSFEKRDRLRIHILHVHEKHRPHKCTVCSKSFSQSSSLNKHMRVHSGERPYKCVYCNKAFTASSILRTHIRQHSGEKPFKCKYCGKAFASHAAHDSHVRRTHCITNKDKEANLIV